MVDFFIAALASHKVIAVSRRSSSSGGAAFGHFDMITIPTDSRCVKAGWTYLSPSFAVILVFLTALACSDAGTEDLQTLPEPSPAATALSPAPTWTPAPMAIAAPAPELPQLEASPQPVLAGVIYVVISVVIRRIIVTSWALGCGGLKSARQGFWRGSWLHSCHLTQTAVADDLGQPAPGEWDNVPITSHDRRESEIRRDVRQDQSGDLLRQVFTRAAVRTFIAWHVFQVLQERLVPQLISDPLLSRHGRKGRKLQFGRGPVTTG